MPETLHVAIVDDHPLFREGVAHTLSAQPDIEIVGEGESAADAIRIAAERIPDVMWLDVSMPGGGLSAVREIAATFPVIKLVMLTVSEDEDDVTAALRAGARGYVLKGVAARELVRIMRAVASGEVYVTPSLAASLLFELSGGLCWRESSVAYGQRSANLQPCVTARTGAEGSTGSSCPCQGCSGSALGI